MLSQVEKFVLAYDTGDNDIETGVARDRKEAWQ